MKMDITEKEYRQLPMNSYSSFKDFLFSKIYYYRKYVLKEKMKNDLEFKENVQFGQLVDCLLLEDDSFEDRYMVSTAVKPSGQMQDFSESFANMVIENTNEFGTFCGNYETIMDMAYNIAGFKRDKLDTVKKRFLTDKEGYDYAMELIQKGDKAVITSEDLEYAITLVDYLRNHDYTSVLLNFNGGYQGMSCKRQMKLTGTIDGMDVKMMADFVWFDHETYTIDPYDLKVGENTDNFAYQYLRMKYYIQNYVYTELLRQNFPDWEVRPVTFLSVDRYKQNSPILYRTTENHLADAYNGFKVNGREYKGVKDIILDLQWHNETNIWSSTREMHKTKGLVTLNYHNQTENE